MLAGLGIEHVGGCAGPVTTTLLGFVTDVGPVRLAPDQEIWVRRRGCGVGAPFDHPRWTAAGAVREGDFICAPARGRHLWYPVRPVIRETYRGDIFVAVNGGDDFLANGYVVRASGPPQVDLRTGTRHVPDMPRTNSGYDVSDP